MNFILFSFYGRMDLVEVEKMAKKRRRKTNPFRLGLIVICGVLCIVLVICLGAIGLRVAQKEKVADEQPKVLKKEIVEEKKTKGSSSFSFVGVGDNLIHGAIYYWQMLAGNGYQFDDIYEMTNPYVQNADFAYINQEVICNGEEYGLNSYPVFNAPREILDAVANAGYDWLSTSSNHCMDTGASGLIDEMNYLDETYPEIVYTGTHTSEKAKSEYTVVDLNGIRVGLLGYTYGLNGYSLPEDMPWLVDLIDEDLIRDDMKKISEISDVQIVAMHWGTEYVTSVTDEQAKFAEILNECGAEVIIGTHPHVIEPCEIYHGENQDTLIYYSLGNFLSAQDTVGGMIGGMASFTLNYNFDTKEVSFSDVKFIPTVTYFNSQFTSIKTTTLHEYTDDMAATHGTAGTTRQAVVDYVNEVIGSPEGIEVVLE